MQEGTAKALVKKTSLMDSLRAKMNRTLRLREEGEARGVLHVNDQLEIKPDPTSPEEKRATIQHIEDVVRWFNGMFTRLELPIYVDATRLLQHIQSSTNHCAPVETYSKRNSNQVKSGILYENNVINLERILRKFLEAETRVLNLLGACQSGKTTQNLSVIFVGPIMYVLTTAESVKDSESSIPTVYYPILFTPQRISLREESNEALDNLFDLYGMLDFISSDDAVCGSLDKLRQAAQVDRLNGFAADASYYKTLREDGRFGIEFNSYEYNILERSRSEVKQGFAYQVSSRATEAEMEKVKAYIQTTLDSNNKRIQRVRREFILIADEADHGSHVESRMAKFLRKKVCYDGQMRSLLELIRSGDTGSYLINSSATLYEYFDQRVDAETINLKLGKGYVGWNQHNGDKIDPTATDVKRPNLLSPSDVAFLTGNTFWPFLRRPACTLNDDDHGLVQFQDDLKRCIRRVEAGKKPLKYMESLPLSEMIRVSQLSVAEYEEECVQSLAQHLRWCTNPIRLESGRVVRDNVVIRFSHKRSVTEKMVMRLTNLLPGIKVGAWCSESEAVRAEEFFTTDKPTVMFVVGKARRGDPFPASVRHFIDFTENMGNQSTYEQGLVGRACGYNKYDAERDFTNNIYITEKEAYLAKRWNGALGAYGSIGRRLSMRARSKNGRVPELSVDLPIRRGLSAELNAEMDRWESLGRAIIEPTKLITGKNISKGKIKPQPLPVLRKHLLVSDANKPFFPVFRKDFDVAEHVNTTESVLTKLGYTRLHVCGVEDALGAKWSGADFKSAPNWPKSLIESKKYPYWLAAEQGSPYHAEISHQWMHWITDPEQALYDPRLSRAHDHGRAKRTKTSHGGNRRDASAITFNWVRMKDGKIQSAEDVVITTDKDGTKGEIVSGGKWVLLNVVFRCEKPAIEDRLIPKDEAVMDESLAEMLTSNYEEEATDGLEE